MASPIAHAALPCWKTCGPRGQDSSWKKLRMERRHRLPCWQTCGARGQDSSQNKLRMARVAATQVVMMRMHTAPAHVKGGEGEGSNLAKRILHANLIGARTRWRGAQPLKRQHTKHTSGRCFATREANVFTARFLEPRTQQVGTGSRVNMRTAWFLSPRTRKVARGSTFASAAQHTPSMMRNDSRRGECRLL